MTSGSPDRSPRRTPEQNRARLVGLFVLGVAVVLLLFGFFVLTVPAGVVSGDAGEFAHVKFWGSVAAGASVVGLAFLFALAGHPERLGRAAGRVEAVLPARAARVEPSPRGELEITTLLETYLADGLLTVELMGRSFAWLDTGTHGSLLDAGNFVRTLSVRQGLQSGCPEEIAFNAGWITPNELATQAKRYAKNEYGKYLARLLE